MESRPMEPAMALEQLAAFPPTNSSWIGWIGSIPRRCIASSLTVANDLLRMRALPTRSESGYEPG